MALSLAAVCEKVCAYRRVRCIDALLKQLSWQATSKLNLVFPLHLLRETRQQPA
jgi:hypothetical protein